MRAGPVAWVSACVALLIAGCSEPPSYPPRPVLTVRVEPYLDEVIGHFAGSIQPRHEVLLGFRVGGRITRRLVDVGQHVEAGTLLAELYPGEWRNTLLARRGDLAEVAARYANADSEARRQQQLFASGVGSKAQLEQARTRLNKLAADLEQARSAERVASDQLSYSRLYSDSAGVVTAWHAEVGQVVVAGQGVLSVARAQARDAVLDLPAELVEHLPSDVRFRVRAELEPKVEINGVIRELAPQADAKTRSRRVRLRLDRTPPEFHLGTSVLVELSKPVPPRSRLPASALLEREGRSLVWVVDPQHAQVTLRDVQVLARQKGTIVIGEGLGRGERVVIAGVGSLREGQQVRVDEGGQ